jgi:hypothetical protein
VNKQRLCAPAPGHHAPCRRGAGPSVLVPLAVFVLVAGCLGGCGSSQKRHRLSTAVKASAFAVLHTPGSGDEQMPSWVSHDLVANGEPTLSATNVRGARRVLANQQAWLIPAPEGKLCLARIVNPLVPEINGERLYPSLTRSCASLSETEAGQLHESQSLSTSFKRRMPTRVVGVVPDGVSEVTINYEDSGSTKVTVTRNAYEDVLINPSSVSFTATARNHSHRYVVKLSSVAGANSTPYDAGQSPSPF